jgi:hypothetical protein
MPLYENELPEITALPVFRGANIKPFFYPTTPFFILFVMFFLTPLNTPVLKALHAYLFL